MQADTPRAAPGSSRNSRDEEEHLQNREANEPQGADDEHEAPSAYREPEVHSDNEPAGHDDAPSHQTPPDAQPNEPVDEITEEDMTRDFDEEVLDLAKDKSLSRKQRAKKKKSLLARQAIVMKEKDRRAIIALDAKLPRPDWYTSDDEEDSIMTDVEKEEVSELKAQPPDGQGRLFLILYTVLSFVAFVFHLTSSCPIPWMRGHGRQYGVWRAKGGGLPVLKVNNIHDCSNEMQYWQAAAALSVICTFVSCGAWISGLLLCFSKGHMGASFALSFYGAVFSLASWALVVALYHYFRCGKGVFANIGVHLDAGFALTLIAWVCHLAALALLAVHFLRFWTRSVHSGQIHPMRFVYMACLIVTMLFYCVGMAYNMWSKSFPLVKVSVTMWHVEIYDRKTNLRTFLNRQTYKCTTITRRMKVVAAFIILSLIWIFFALIFATGACFDSRFIQSSLIFGYTSVIFALVGWITLIVTRHGHLCTGATPKGVSAWADLGYNGIPSGINNAQIRFDGYALKEGFGLIVAGWALSTVAVVLNTVLHSY
ncbi:Amastin surface glycoprotein [Lotmaria passim]